MEYSMDAALERIRRIDAHLEDFSKSGSNPELAKQADEIRKSLAAVRADIVPPRFDPEHLNLMPRIGEFTNEVSNYSGRPTAAQEEYIDAFGDQLRSVLARLDDVIEKQLKPLNDQLAASHVPNISPELELTSAK
jgi:hypothetical protein